MLSKIFTNINFRVFRTIAKFAKINRTRKFPVLQYCAKFIFMISTLKRRYYQILKRSLLAQTAFVNPYCNVLFDNVVPKFPLSMFDTNKRKSGMQTLPSQFLSISILVIY